MRPRESEVAAGAGAQYTLVVDPKDLRAFVHRDWTAVGAAKRTRAAEAFRRDGPARLLRAARALFDHARAVNPAWPPARERSADLEQHVKVKRWLDRAAHVRGR
jgi:hypothetical protein